MKRTLKKLIITLLVLCFAFPSMKALASSDEFIKGDGGYEDGMYLNPISAYSDTRGEQKNPYFEDKRDIVSKEEAKEILKDKKLQLLVDSYNKLYQNVIKLYKYGYNHMDSWKKVKNMDDPVFGKINKQNWVDIYEKCVLTLQKTRYYFYSIGLTDEMYTYEKTLSMADMEELKFPEIKFYPVQ